jgi:hypothetical protein
MFSLKETANPKAKARIKIVLIIFIKLLIYPALNITDEGVHQNPAKLTNIFFLRNKGKEE